VSSFRHTDKAGRNSFYFARRIRGKTLMPGAYRLKAMPTFAGRSGAAHTVGFQIVR
jgi:hypothetical protein